MTDQDILNQPIDDESQAFIDWSFKQMEDPVFYKSFVEEARTRFNAFYAQPQAAVLTQLKTKMWLGAVEHGAPQHTIKKVKSEIDKEYVDLLGWMLVERWVAKKEQNERNT